MSLFDSIIAGVKERAGLSADQAGGLLAALLGLFTDPRGGGFGGSLELFHRKKEETESLSLRYGTLHQAVP